MLATFLIMSTLLASPKYSAVPLSGIRLEPSVFKTAMDANARYLLSLDPDRLLHNFYENAGLPTRGEAYGGWEKMGVAGHSLGHYLTAISHQYAATGDKEFLRRERDIVQRLKECQAKRGSGYVGGIPKEDQLWAEIARGDVRSQGFDLNGYWVPWYTVHKLLAGLIDAYNETGDKDALEVATRLGDWIDQLLKPLDEFKMQKMLACEYGGMNDALAQLSEATGEQRYLLLAERFYDHRVLDPLLKGKDELAGKHANTQIPKVIGLVRIARQAKRPEFLKAAAFFWERVADHHSYVIGGNSDHEHFGPPDELSDRLSTNTAETCNTYNMLKLSHLLFEETGDWKYMEFYERGLVNHILASQDHESGMMCYYVSLLPGTAKVFSTPFDSFWCCVGTGMENHTKYGDSVAYAFGTHGLAIAQYMPSTITAQGFELRLETDYPSQGHIKVTVLKAPEVETSLEFRHPTYSAGRIPVKVNGALTDSSAAGDGAFAVNRIWHAGDSIEFTLDMPLHTEAILGKASRVALLQGPTVLAAVSPPNAESESFDVVMPAKKTLATIVANDKDGLSLPATEGHPTARLIPFWSAEQEKTSVYFDTFSPAEWTAKLSERDAERKRLADIERRTVDTFRPGEMQSERDHTFVGQNVETGDNGGRKWRHAFNGGWFQFQLAVDSEVDNDLVLTFWGSDSGRTFDVLADGTKLKTITLNGSHAGQFFDQTLALGRRAHFVTIRFLAHPGNFAGGLYGARVVRH